MKIKTRLICNRIVTLPDNDYLIEAEELQPARRIIKINNKVYYLPLPYIQNLKIKSFYPDGSYSVEIYCFCSKQPAKFFNDLCHVPLPNIFDNGAVCQKNKNVNDFWSSEFNYSLLDNVKSFMRKNFDEIKNCFRIDPIQIDGFFAWWELQNNTDKFDFVKPKSSFVKNIKVFE